MSFDYPLQPSSSRLQPSSSQAERLALKGQGASSLFDQLLIDVECPVSHLSLYTAVCLIPCCHKVNQVVAERVFEPPIHDGLFGVNSGECPICKVKVCHYCPDFMMRTIARVICEAKIERLRQELTNAEIILPVAHRVEMIFHGNGVSMTLKPLSVGFPKQLFNEILCPITSDLLTSAITLFPCGHKISSKGIRLLQSHEERRSIQCPLCREKVEIFFNDLVMSNLVQKVIDAKQEKRSIEHCGIEMIRDLAIRLAVSNHGEVAIEAARIITSKKIRAKVLREVDEITRKLSLNLFEEVRSLAEKGFFQKAAEVAVSIPLPENKREAITCVFQAEERAKEAASSSSSTSCSVQ